MGPRELSGRLDCRTCKGDGLILVNVAGILRDGLLNRTVHKTGHSGCILQTLDVGRCSILCDFSELINLVKDRLRYIFTVNNRMPDCQDPYGQ